MSADGDELDADEYDDLQRTIVELGLCNGGRDYCTPADFTLAMLVRQEKVYKEDIMMAMSTFTKLDADGSGELDAEDVRLFAERERQKAAESTAKPAIKE